MLVTFSSPAYADIKMFGDVAIRKLVKKFCPDVSKQADAGERFKEVGDAYGVIKDPERRAAYLLK